MSLKIQIAGFSVRAQQETEISLDSLPLALHDRGCLSGQFQSKVPELACLLRFDLQTAAAYRCQFAFASNPSPDVILSANPSAPPEIVNRTEKMF